MASLFMEINTCDERLEFSGSSAEDIACAKLFWQTVCLLPHLESGLVSADVTQRRRSAPLPGSSTKCSQKELDSGTSDDFLAKVAVARQADEQQRLERLAALRSDDRERLAKHRLHRERLEQRIHRSRFKKVLPPIQNAAAARETMALIDQFEKDIIQTSLSPRPDTA